jgi:hypothetical protein
MTTEDFICQAAVLQSGLHRLGDALLARGFCASSKEYGGLCQAYINVTNATNAAALADQPDTRDRPEGREPGGEDGAI